MNFKRIILIFAFNLFIHSNCDESIEEQQTVPDLVVEVNVDGNDIQLEAFKSKQNDEIMAQNSTKNYGRLKWFSLGHPVLVEMKSSSNISSLFHYSSKGFFSHIQLLTIEQKKLFLKEIKSLYNIEVGLNQIVNMPLTLFKCDIGLHDGENETIVEGDAALFTKFPIRIDFKASSKEIEMLTKSVKRDPNDFQLKCEINTNFGYSHKFSIYTEKQTPVFNICGLKYSGISGYLQNLVDNSSK